MTVGAAVWHISLLPVIEDIVYAVLKSLLYLGNFATVPELYCGLVYKFKKIMVRTDFLISLQK